MQHHAQTVIQPTQSDLETKATKGSRGKKSFKCKDCNESFIQSSQCKSHERIHTNGKPLISASIVINASSSPSSSGSMNELTRAKNRMNASIAKNALQRQQIASHMREFIRE